MTPLEAAQSRHYLTERHKGFRLCAACLMSWPCDFQIQRAETFRVQADAERLAEVLRGVIADDQVLDYSRRLADAALAAHEAGA